MEQQSYFFGDPKILQVDSKSRAIIPADIRRVLYDRAKQHTSLKDFIYMVSDGQNLRCYGAVDYLVHASTMLELDAGNNKRQKYFSAHEVEMDRQGRIPLPEKYTTIDKVVFQPNGDCFYIKPGGRHKRSK